MATKVNNQLARKANKMMLTLKRCFINLFPFSIHFAQVMQRVIGEAMSGVESHDANRNVAVQSVQNNGGRNGRSKFSSSAGAKNAKQKNSIPSESMPLALPKGTLSVSCQIEIQ